MFDFESIVITRICVGVCCGGRLGEVATALVVIWWLAYWQVLDDSPLLNDHRSCCSTNSEKQNNLYVPSRILEPTVCILSQSG